VKVGLLWSKVGHPIYKGWVKQFKSYRDFKSSRWLPNYISTLQ
jgi:hypothetical protein